MSQNKYVAYVWFERDRQNLRLETEQGEEVFDLWDEDVDAAITDGFLEPPRGPRATAAQWLPQLVAYAKERGLM